MFSTEIAGVLLTFAELIPLLLMGLFFILSVRVLFKSKLENYPLYYSYLVAASGWLIATAAIDRAYYFFYGQGAVEQSYAYLSNRISSKWYFATNYTSTGPLHVKYGCNKEFSGYILVTSYNKSELICPFHTKGEKDKVEILKCDDDTVWPRANSDIYVSYVNVIKYHEGKRYLVFLKLHHKKQNWFRISATIDCPNTEMLLDNTGLLFRSVPFDVVFSEIASGSVAEGVGLAAGDRVISYNGHDIASIDQLIQAISDNGQPAIRNIKVQRGLSTLTFQVPAGRLEVTLGYVEARK
jgi:hypothetical protein